MKNLKIGMKLALTFAIIIVLMLTSSIISTVSLSSIGGNFDEFYEKPYVISTKSMEMQANIEAIAKNIMQGITVPTVSETKTYFDVVATETTVLKEDYQYIMDNYSGDKTSLKLFYDTMIAADPIQERLRNAAMVLDNELANKIYFDEYVPSLNKAIAALEVLDQEIEVYAKGVYDSSKVVESYTSLLNVAFAAINLIVSVVLAIYITKLLTRPIKEIEVAANKMANGDLNASVSYVSKDEVGQLAGSMKDLTATLKDIIDDVDYLLGEMAIGKFDIKSKIGEAKYVGDFMHILTSIREINTTLNGTLLSINEAADQVSDGSGQVSDGAQALSQGATEQASSVEELSASVMEITEQVKTNASHAQTARTRVDSTGAKILQSNEQMKVMINAMGDISDRSSEINKIIKTIEDIAFQTNILALNAAVEAARAGNAGKGFAVVADEVRNLASKSAEAAKNTTVLIESTVQAVEHGTKIANETAASMMAIVEETKSVVAVIDDIAKSSDEQQEAVMQVSEGINQISTVVQTNSATAQESAAASEELSGQAQMLKDLVGKFTLNRDAIYQDQGMGMGRASASMDMGRAPARSSSSKISINLDDDKY